MTATSTSRRHLFLVSGLLLSLVACGGDDSGAGNADSGTDDVFTPGPDGTTGQPDSAPGPDGTVADTGSPTGDSGGNPSDGGPDAAEDTGTPDGSKPDGGETDGGTDAGTDGGEVDAAANVPNDPIALWHFDEASGSVAYDSSGHGHTATLFGGATFAPGKHGSGLSPNASGWAMIPASLPISDAGLVDAGAGTGSDASDDAGATDADTTDSDADAATDDASSADAGGAADASGGADAGPAFAPLVWDTTKSFSVVCWVKVYSKGPGQWQTAFSRDANHLSVFTLKLRGDNPEQFDFDFPGADDTTTGLYAVAQSATSPAVSLLDGGADYWYHLAGVLDRDPADAGAATVRIYVNGVAEATTTPTTPILAAVGDTFIGAGLFNTRSNSWNGVIDEVALYDRALTAVEVAALYTTTK